jgi:hypothetical protein
MSKTPFPIPSAPSAYQLEKSVSLYQQFADAVFTDDLDLDENEIGELVRQAGGRPPAEMLARLIDVAIALDRRADHLDGLRKRYAARRAAYLARLERTRGMVGQLLDVLGISAAEGDLGSAGLGKARATVEADVTKLPEEYIRRTDPEPKKLEIAAALKAGKEVPGAGWKDLTNAPPVLRIIAY